MVLKLTVATSLKYTAGVGRTIDLVIYILDSTIAYKNIGPIDFSHSLVVALYRPNLTL